MSAAERWEEADWLPVVCPGCGHPVPGLDLPPGGVARTQCGGKRRARPIYDSAARERRIWCGTWLLAHRVGDGPVHAERIYRPRRARHEDER